MNKRKSASDSPSIPKESCGRCISKKRDGKRCKRSGILADGLCMKCWDKAVGYKDDLIYK